MKRVWLILLFLVAATAAAHADDRDKARAAFRLGSQHYALGEYKEALVAFKEAYRSFEDPSFLFNIAQCERQLADRADALRAYRMYLVTSPDAANREEVRGLIARLEHELAEERATKAAPPPGVEPPGAIGGKQPARNDAAKLDAAPAKLDAPAASPALTLTSAPPPRHDRPAYQKWWVWTVVGVVAAGGAAAGVAIALTRHAATPTANTSFGTASPF